MAEINDDKSINTNDSPETISEETNVAKVDSPETPETPETPEEEEEAAVDVSAEDQGIALKLSDVIEIIAPANEMLNKKQFIIDYIDEHRIQLISLIDFATFQLNLDENGVINNNSITEINLISRNSERGYARQNGLLPGKWVNIHFGGDVPSIVVCEITNLEEDMIEITTYPDNKVKYINFNYKGIPENLPITLFEFREKPEQQPAQPSREQSQEIPVPESAPVSPLEEITPPPDTSQPQFDVESLDDHEEFNQVGAVEMEDIFIDADKLDAGLVHEPIVQYVDVNVESKRYNIDIQANDLLDSILSVIPTNKRNARIMKQIHTEIERFKYLRIAGSDIDRNGTITNAHFNTHLHKPLKSYLHFNDKVNKKLFWVLFSAKNKKIIYDVVPAGKNKPTKYTNDPLQFPDLELIDNDDNLNEMNEIIQNIQTRAVTTGSNKYVDIYDSINMHLSSFEDVDLSAYNRPGIIKLVVNNDIDVIADNFETYYSSAVSNYDINQKKFVMNRYTTGLTHLDIVSRTETTIDAVPVPLTPSTPITITSVLTLPESAIRFSRVNLPGTNILDSANLNRTFLDYWKLLKQHTTINEIRVEPTENTPVEYQKIPLNEPNATTPNPTNPKKTEDNTNTSYFDKINGFVLNQDENASVLQDGSRNYMLKQKQNYNNFVDNIIPTTKDIFNIMKKYIAGKVSLTNIVSCLEPFLIYCEDLTFKQYQIINDFIDCRISKYNTSFIERGRQFARIKSLGEKTFKPTPESSTVVNSLNSNFELKQNTFLLYKYDGSVSVRAQFLTNSELLKRVILTDFGNLINAAWSLYNLQLTYPTNLDPLFKTTKTELQNQMNTDMANNTCASYVIAKKYKTKVELEADNNIAVFYDKEFDKTPYDIKDSLMAKFDNERERFAREHAANASYEDATANGYVGNEKQWLKREYLSTKLQSKYKYATNDATEMADTLIEGMKKVRDGEYAVFYNTNTGKLEYYVRRNNEWSLAENVSKDLFLDETNMLCDMQPLCSYSEEQLQQSKCNDVAVTKDMVKNALLKNMIDQFDDKYVVSKKDHLQRLEKIYAQLFHVFETSVNIATINKYKNNDKQYAIGLELIDEPEVVTSPYAKFKDIILGQSNLAQKYDNIIKFARRFTRDPLESNKEDVHWLYCIKTNVKLLQKYLLDLATAFSTNPDGYTNVLKIIIKENGVLSEDGDKIVDKYSGYEITQINFSTDEGYEDGFKSQTREVLESDWGDTTGVTSSSSKPLTVLSPETQLITKIVGAISTVIGFTIPAQMEFIIRNVKNTMNEIMPTKEELAIKNEVLEKKGKNVVSYEDTKETVLLYLTLGMYVVATQTSIPPIKTRKTFPGCNTSFAGFPLENNKDMSFINYLSCIVHKIRTSSTPWKALMKKKEDYIATNIFNYIEQHLLTNQEVLQSIKNKQEYIHSSLSGIHEKLIVARFSIQNMTTYLPPLNPIHLTNLHPVATSFNQSLLHNLQTGSFRQHEEMCTLEAKIIFFSLAIQSEIQEVIDEVVTKNIAKTHKYNLLINHGSTLALQNACCNEEYTNNSLDYFIRKRANIKTYNDLVESYSKVMYEIKQRTTALSFLSIVNTKNVFPPPNLQFNKETIYRAFIHYCRFNTIKPLSDAFRVICKEKPANFKLGLQIPDQIKLLEENGATYSVGDMMQLLLIVSRKNIISDSAKPVALTQSQKLRIICDNLVLPAATSAATSDTGVGAIFPENFRTSLINVIDAGESDQIHDLRNFLLTANKNMKKLIMAFISKHANVSSLQRDKLTAFLTSIMSWGGSQRNFMQISDNDMYNSINFIKTYLQNLIKIFPNIILKENSYVDFKTNMPKHWGISSADNRTLKDFIVEYYTSLSPFYGNNKLNNILTEIQYSLSTLIDMANTTPSMTNININEDQEPAFTDVFDKTTSFNLFEYYFLKTLMTYITVSESGGRQPRTRPVAGALSDIYSGEINDSMQTIEDETYNEYTSQMNAGDIKDAKDTVGNLLVAYLNVMMNHKNKVNFTYESVMDNVFKIQLKEKKTFTDKFEGYSKELLQVDKILQTHKLNDWNKGLQKGLTKYNKNADDDDVRRNNEEYRKLENKLMQNANVNDQNIQQYMDDYLEEQEREAAIDEEEYGMGNIGEDYFDGNPYGDEPEE